MSQIGSTYGGALYGLARDEGVSDRILDELNTISGVFSENPDFIALLSEPGIPKAERCGILDETFRGKVHGYTLNFLKLLTERGYARYVADCTSEYEKMYNADNDILPVSAVTSAPLAPELEARLIDKLTATTGKKIKLTCRVDTSVLGGIRLEYDGKQLDGTLRHRLEDIRDILKNTVV